MVKIELSRRDYVAIAGWAVLFTIAIVLLTLAIDYTNLRALDGEQFRINLRNDIMIPTVLGLPNFCVVFWKIRQLSQAKRKLEILASTDGLTGCLNRRAFTERVIAKLLAKTADSTECALMAIDLDHFKHINDRFGHAEGDRALVTVTTAIVAALGPGDIFGRMGGEEFAVFMPRANAESARLAAERIRLSVLASEFQIGDENPNLSTSIGVALGQKGSNFDALYRDADRKLYEAKSTGRNRVVFSSTFIGEPPVSNARKASRS